MQKAFLGRGVGFPICTGPDGTLKSADFEESVRQSIWVILGTAKGERVMRPDFGCGIYTIVFRNNSSALAGRVAQEVRESLLMFEPRIDVLSVVVTPQNRGEVLLISVDYEVRATNNVFNLVYPFYLERSSAQ